MKCCFQCLGLVTPWGRLFWSVVSGAGLRVCVDIHSAWCNKRGSQVEVYRTVFSRLERRGKRFDYEGAWFGRSTSAWYLYGSSIRRWSEFQQFILESKRSVILHTMNEFYAFLLVT